VSIFGQNDRNREINRELFSFLPKIPKLCPNSAILLLEQGISRELAGNFQIRA
jgi:hypothetical protein